LSGKALECDQIGAGGAGEAIIRRVGAGGAVAAAGEALSGGQVVHGLHVEPISTAGADR
jgi:hypothetical protein